MNERYKNHLEKQGFELLETIGNGLSGKTVKAYQPSLGRHIAIKFFDSLISRKDANLKKRLLRESKLLADLQHPAIPYVITCGNIDDNGELIPYTVMQYISDITLEKFIKENSPVEFEKVKSFAYQILDALSFIHEKGIVHRDIKPSNIMILPSGHCFLIDFSIGFKIDPDPGMTRVTKTGDHLGTYLYMSPEQSKNMLEVDHRSDIYSFSKVLCELLTGKPELDSINNSSIKHYDLLRKIIEKGCCYSAENRYQSASEFKRDLSQITDSFICYKENPAKAVCVNTKCPSANWSPNGYYRGPNFIEESSDAHCTSCGSKLVYQCPSCGAKIANTPFCGGCGTEQFKIPECKKCGSYLTKSDMEENTAVKGCNKCRRKAGQKQTRFTASSDFPNDIPF